MNLMTDLEFQVRAIPADVLDQLRTLDDAGRRPRAVHDAEGGSPLRCCLRKSRPGEDLLLASYAPVRRWAASVGAEPGPYDEVGPVFIHPSACGGIADAGYPDAFRSAHRVFRAYNSLGGIHGGRLVKDGSTAEAVLADLFADPEVAAIHVRAVEYGCFLFEVRRPSV